jgi:hypothetical protein
MNDDTLNKLKPYRYHLAVISILVLIKFVFMPIVAWQNSLLAEVELLEARKNKINLLVNNKSKTESRLKDYDNALKPMANIFNKKQLDSDFKLAQQKWLESVMESHHLSVKNISWELVSTIESPKIMQFQLKVNFSGKAEDLRGIIQSLESQTPLVYIANLIVNIKKQYPTYLGNADGSLTLHFYMKNTQINGD